MTTANETEPVADEADADEEDQQKDARRNAIEWAVIIVAALLAALLIKTFAIQAFHIPSESMHPTLKERDRVLVNKVSYNVDRGSVIVFKRPPNAAGTDPAIKDLIKRVVGMPGEKVEVKEGHVFINDKELDEPYLPADTTMTNEPAVVVPPDHYFMMGDNRLSSLDSRRFGPIHKDLIVGRAFIRVWPPTSLKWM